MINYFTMDNKKSLDYGLYITGSGAFNAPERAIERLEVPGRNGSLVIDKGYYKNITQSYKGFIHRDFAQNAEGLRAWLLSKQGYRRLEDTYNPEHYRLARYSGPLDFNVRALCAGAEMELLFDCKPQRFLKTGDQPVSVPSGSSIVNRTEFPALPLIKVIGSGSGTLTIGKQNITISSISSFVMIDCELQDAYKGTENKNGTISLNEFPTLEPGKTPISYSGGITAVTITPRWWTL